jgi:hypothetical protein
MRRRRPIHVIASAAKQSILPLRRAMDCFAPLAMTAKHTSASPRRNAPEPLKILSPRNEGAGNAGCLLHPRSRVQNSHKRKRTRAYRHSRSIPASLRNGFTVYAVLSPATNSSCHRRRRIKGLVAPGWANKNLRRLDTSNGCQDHTVLPYAAIRLRLKVSSGQARLDPKGSAGHWRRSSGARWSLTGNPPCDLVRARRRCVHRISSQRS